MKQITEPKNYTGRAIAIPFFVLLAGFAVETIVPGCKWDEGMGGHGCIFGPINILLDLLIFGGIIGFFVGFFIVAPITSIAYRIAVKKHRKLVESRELLE